MKKYLFLFFKKITNIFRDKNLKAFPGAVFFYDFLLNKIKPTKGIILIPCQGNKMYVDASDTGVAPDLLYYGLYGSHIIELIKRKIKPDMTVLDLGANIGFYTLYAAKLVGNKGKVYAFEPEPKNYQLLLRNIQINNFKNIIPIQKAVSNSNGKTQLYLDKTNLCKHSFSENNISEKSGSIEVETTTLDTFFKDKLEFDRIDFIKIDVEGAEGLAIKGAQKILQNKNLQILLEFWPSGQKNMGTDPFELLKCLQEYGFKIKLPNNIHQSITPSEVIELCEKVDDRKGYIDLLLEK
jgi:FkbM family methyltransferase